MIDATLGAIIGGISAASTNAANINLQRETNAQNVEEAQKNRDYQTEMSNTAHRREVADLQAAGLNPILSTHGTGSSTPGGDSATLTAPQVQLPDLFSYGVSLKQLQQADKKLDQEDTKIALDVLNSKSTREAQKYKTRKDRYGIEGMISDIFEKADQYKAEDATKGLKKLFKQLQHGPRMSPSLEPEQPTNMIGVP